MGVRIHHQARTTLRSRPVNNSRLLPDSLGRHIIGHRNAASDGLASRTGRVVSDEGLDLRVRGRDRRLGLRVRAGDLRDAVDGWGDGRWLLVDGYVVYCGALALGGSVGGLVDKRKRHTAPVCVLEIAGLGRHVISTCRGLGLACRIRTPHAAGPVTTERRVEHHVVVLEVGRDVAGRAAEVRGGRAPLGRVGGALGDVGGDDAPRELPDLDAGLGPFHGVDAALHGVEVGVRAWVYALGAAARVGLVRVVLVAVGCDEGAWGGSVGGGSGWVVEPTQLGFAVDGAAVARVECHHVGGLSVYAFQDVYHEWAVSDASVPMLVSSRDNRA